MIVLGIETSCDETSAAVVSGGRRVLSSVVSSQFELHECHGGVVPELAARRHVTAIVPVVEQALREADVDRDDLDAIAVTQGPGLAGALVVGMNAAKAMAYALDRPLVAVNHLEAHIYANWLCDAPDLPEEPVFPILCLLVSGGHTELILMTGHGRFRHLGRTLDDAAGEAFDKGARLLGLGFPGGPAIEEAAREGDPHAFELPRAWLTGTHDFSFSGLKTALLRLTEPMRVPVSERESDDHVRDEPVAARFGLTRRRSTRRTPRLPILPPASNKQSSSRWQSRPRERRSNSALARSFSPVGSRPTRRSGSDFAMKSWSYADPTCRSPIRHSRTAPTMRPWSPARPPGSFVAAISSAGKPMSIPGCR